MKVTQLLLAGSLGLSLSLAACRGIEPITSAGLDPTATQRPARPTRMPRPPRTATPTPTPPAVTPTPVLASGLVDVGGYTLYVNCIGAGSPTIIMDAGLTDTSATWDAVVADVGQLSRTCVYDRAGLGQSEKGPKPRTSRQIVTELHALLQNGGIPGPYILVGHSFGGLNVRLYADQYAADIAGMVLIDALSADQLARFEALLEPNELQQIRTWLRFNAEGVDLEQSIAEVRAARDLGDLPLVVVSSALRPGLPPSLTPQRSDELWQAQRALQADLVQLSTNGTQNHCRAKRPLHSK